MRAHMRKKEVLGEVDEQLAKSVGLTLPDLESMYRLLAIAKSEDRYVIPQAHTELASRLLEQQGACGLDFEDGPGNCGAVPGRLQSLLNPKFMLTRRLPVVPFQEAPANRESGGGGATE
jgi:nitrate reductase beta subunit